ncbi:39S ribosomal protein L51 mitochondrial [Fasciola hepatica]|uniref:Large ribosomal subunit protein mL51 n=1 Tax=Fasciola hepatica TaxID=6192 RepID=A0A2H1C8S4_FASHE|nr:39S ribosomal protein L51 mitochondrial [Fasciola hepatica]
MRLERCGFGCMLATTRSFHYSRWTCASTPRSPWRKFNVSPEKGGTFESFRDSGLKPPRIIPVTPRATSIANGGGSGAPYQESYLQPKPSNLRYNPRLYEGGLLPRLDFTDEPVYMPDYRPKDYWAPHRAHFGQNDYIDILGDGKLQPKDFYAGPQWVLGARNEFQRVCARLNNPALLAWMEEFEPSRLHLEEKRKRYLYKTVNKRKNIKFLKYRDAP